MDGTEETGAFFIDLCTPDGTVHVYPLTDTTGEESPRPLQVYTMRGGEEKRRGCSEPLLKPVELLDSDLSVGTIIEE